MADGKGFDLGAMLAGLTDVSDLDTNREQITYISLTLIDSDPNNFYQLSGIEELAANIATCGLQQPIRVRKHPEAEGRYMIVSGHRRCAALELLSGDDPERWADIPCIVESDSISPALQQLRLIYANSNTRTLTSPELNEQAVQVEKLLYQLKEEGYEFPGRMRDHVAQAVGASQTKLARLKVIRENLKAGWYGLYQENQVFESTAYAIAQMPFDLQRNLLEVYRNKLSDLKEENVRTYSRNAEFLRGLDCPVHKAKCKNADRMINKCMRDKYTFNNCRSCCINCSDLMTCRYSCEKAADKKKELRSHDNEMKQAAADKVEKANQEHIAYIASFYARIAKARMAAGVSAAEYYESRGFVASANAVKLELAREQGKMIDERTYIPIGTYFGERHVDDLLKAADTLKCSVDYLLGRTENLSPVVSELWHYAETATPVKSGSYVCLVMVRSEKIIPTSMDFDGEEWLYMGAPISDTDVDLLYWTEFPE